METLHELVCANCAKEFSRSSRQLSSSKAHNVKHFFCGRSCSVSYANRHHAKRELRSFVEIWIEGRIKELHPHLEVLYNNKDVLPSGGELDIYIPPHRLAFELQGPQHYSGAIYGEDNYQKTIANDAAKAKACLEEGIELLIVDISRVNSIRRDPEFAKVIEFVLLEINNRVVSVDSNS
jgi:hypothetical protein